MALKRNASPEPIKIADKIKNKKEVKIKKKQWTSGARFFQVTSS